MSYDRLAWLCAGLFVVFAIPLAFLEDNGWRNLSGGFSLLSLGSFALALAAGGLAKGQIQLQFTPIVRAVQPRLFWASIALVAITGSVVVIGGIWALFFKS